MNDLFSRYSRQIFIEEVGVSGQRKLQSSKVLIVGAGGLGSPVIQYLAAAGVGTIAVVDFDILEMHNLNRQIIHNESNLGRYKVDSAFEYVKSFNSSISFIPIQEKITAKNVIPIFAPYDIVIDGSDNFTSRYIINDACVQLNKVLIYGSIFAHEGQVAVFNHQGGKNLRHLFPTPPDPKDVPNCDMFGVLGALPGIVGSIMAMQVLQIIIGLDALHNQLLLIDTKKWQFNKIGF